MSDMNECLNPSTEISHGVFCLFCFFKTMPLAHINELKIIGEKYILLYYSL